MHGFHDPQTLTEARALSLIAILIGKRGSSASGNTDSNTRRFKGARRVKKS